MVGGLLLHEQLRALHRIATAEISVIVLGESGTGKELVARELHAASGRRGSFQAVNCAAIPATLLESELFGYKRGAFSGADRDKPGIFRAAGIPTAICGPGDIAQAHQPNEFLAKSQLAACEAFIGRLIGWAERQ